MPVKISPQEFVDKWSKIQLKETAEPYPLQRTDLNPDETRKAYKATLRADKEKGLIHLDTYTSLSDVPPEAWSYMLGNRSALEWILDRYKEKKPRDPTIR